MPRTSGTVVNSRPVGPSLEVDFEKKRRREYPFFLSLCFLFHVGSIASTRDEKRVLVLRAGPPGRSLHYVNSPPPIYTPFFSPASSSSSSFSTSSSSSPFLARLLQRTVRYPRSRHGVGDARLEICISSDVEFRGRTAAEGNRTFNEVTRKSTRVPDLIFYFLLFFFFFFFFFKSQRNHRSRKIPTGEFQSERRRTCLRTGTRDFD